MDRRRTAYTLRLEKASLREKRLGMLAVFSMATTAGVLVLPEVGTMRPGADNGLPGLAATAPRLSSMAAPARTQAAAPRHVYPYSIIPGGVADVEELKRVIRSDRVVALHYANFNVDKAKSVTVTKPRAVYVSYRKGDQVYWTKHKLMLAQGETLFSDGEHEMRARCANRISDLPQFPVEANGPSAEELDTALEGGFLATSAGMGLGDDGAVPMGQRYHPVYFPNGAGLVQPAAATATRGHMTVVPTASVHRPGVDGGGIVRLGGNPAPSGDTPATGTGGSDPATPDAGGIGGDIGDPGGPGGQPLAPAPSVPRPDGSPELPPPTPALPGLPNAPHDGELAPVPVTVPEPGTLWLSGAVFAALLWVRRRGLGAVR